MNPPRRTRSKEGSSARLRGHSINTLHSREQPRSGSSSSRGLPRHRSPSRCRSKESSGILALTTGTIPLPILSPNTPNLEPLTTTASSESLRSNGSPSSTLLALPNRPLPKPPRLAELTVRIVERAGADGGVPTASPLAIPTDAPMRRSSSSVYPQAHAASRRTQPQQQLQQHATTTSATTATVITTRASSRRSSLGSFSANTYHLPSVELPWLEQVPRGRQDSSGVTSSAGPPSPANHTLPQRGAHTGSAVSSAHSNDAAVQCAVQVLTLSDSDMESLVETTGTTNTTTNNNDNNESHSGGGIADETRKEAEMKKGDEKKRGLETIAASPRCASPHLSHKESILRDSPGRLRSVVQISREAAASSQCTSTDSLFTDHSGLAQVLTRHRTHVGQSLHTNNSNSNSASANNATQCTQSSLNSSSRRSSTSSKLKLTSSVRQLRAFLQQHPPETTPCAGAAAAAAATGGDGDGAAADNGGANVTSLNFSDDEKKEIEQLMKDLQRLVGPAEAETTTTRPTVTSEHPNTPQTAAATAAASAETKASLMTTLPPLPSFMVCAPAAPPPFATTTTAANASPIMCLSDDLSEHTTKEHNDVTTENILRRTFPQIRLPATRSVHSSKHSDEFLSLTEHSSTDADTVTPPAVLPKVNSDLTSQTVEGRYTAALKTIEEAASDCEVALKRVQDYSQNLFILVETWMHLHDNRFDEFAQAVLQRMLDDHPSYRVLFHNVEVPHQSLVIMDMIGRAVVAFTRPADLMDIMGEMGARHNLYHVHEEQYDAMRTAFLQVYGEFVGPETYAKSVGVWKMFWKTTIELALSGASSERGKLYAQRRYSVWADRVKRVLKHIFPRQHSGGFHRLMQLTYQRACEQHPRAMQPYHQLADLRTAHRTMEAFMRIVKRVVYAETAPVVGYNEQFSIDHLLTDLASAVAPHDVALMADAFLDACESYTQPALWDEVVRAALRELWLVYVVGYWTARRERVADGAAQEAAPSGREPFCLLFTDIEASTRLWDADPRAMGAAISRHHQVVRGLIEDFGGYEVKTVGDSFLVATNTVTQALLIAFGIQLELMTEPSAPGFRMVDSPQGGGDASCWRGDALRVRVGIHYCTDASAVYDSVHGRFDYYGPSVNCASRVESSACGGQVLLSEDAYAHLRQEDAFAALPANRLYVEQVGKLVRAQEARGVAVARDPQLSWIVEAVERDRAAKTVRRASSSAHAAAASLRNTHVHSAQLQRRNSRGEVMTLQSLTTATDEGLHPLKGIAEPVRLFSLLPLGLTGREFPQMRRTHRHLSESGAGSSFTALFSSTGGLSEGSVNGSAFNSAVRSSEQRSPAQ